jgi:uncharacterized protein (TIGR00661 family)
VKVLYAFQGTGNGHVARARDLVPRFAALCDLDVLVSGTHSEVDLGFPIAFRKHGLSMVYDNYGRVSYWRSLFDNRIGRFLIDIFTLPVKDYDLVIIDFESITSYACLIRGVKSLQLSHQAAYWSEATPRPGRRILHWEWVLRYMSPSRYRIGFHFAPYDDFILPPIIRQEIRDLKFTNDGHYAVYLPAYAPEVLLKFFGQFPAFNFQIFTKVPHVKSYGNVDLIPVGVQEFLQSFKKCKGFITGGGFEGPAEAMFAGKQLVMVPIQGQYEQLANAACAAREGIMVLHSLDAVVKEELDQFFHNKAPISTPYPDYAQALVERILDNAKQGRALDDISTLNVW